MAWLTNVERYMHPTTADIYAILNYDHCDFCEGMATGLQAWWNDPNSVEGTDQLDRLGAHILSEYDIDKEG